MRAVLMLFCVALVGCSPRYEVTNNQGNRLQRSGQVDAALRQYQLSQVSAPDQPVPYYNAAGGLVETGDLDAAEAALRQALRTADDDMIVSVYYNLGEIYFRRGDYIQAAASYREVLLRSPDDGDARYNYELALSRIPTPTQPPSDGDEDQDETSPTPTATSESPSPGEDTPTPQQGPTSSDTQQTPTPEGGSGGAPLDSEGTPIDEDEGAVSQEEAERRLDAVQQDQETLGTYLEAGTPPVLVEEDW